MKDPAVKKIEEYHKENNPTISSVQQEYLKRCKSFFVFFKMIF